MTDTTFDWRSFLVRWSEEWADAQDPDSLTEDDARALRDRWLGFAPADAERLAEAERRLGRRLPPSYRAFLEVSDGWRHAGGFVSLLAGTRTARWHQDSDGLAKVWREAIGRDPSPKAVMEIGLWTDGLQLDEVSDLAYVLLHPLDVGTDGEWALYHYRSWAAAPPRRYASFQEFMADMYREFHQLSAVRSVRDGREFANATTRALDATVDSARRDALAGRYERAEIALSKAEGFGRPRAKALRDQIRRLQRTRDRPDFAGRALDPGYAPELLPVLADEHVRGGGDEASWDFVVRGASDEVRALGEELLRRMREGTFRYTVPGAYGEAVDRAREQARWGGTDAAWRTLRAALPAWEPPGPDLLAPLGLLADPVLGPLITPDRGRELLATPRAGEPGAQPEPVPDTDPDGLVWMASTYQRGYRFVLVEGVEPDELPGLLSEDGSSGFHEPAALRRLRTQPRNRGSSSYDDKAFMAVGRAGENWCFAFDGQPNLFNGRRFVSPAVAASRAGRAVVVWGAPGRTYGPTSDVFHLSVAEQGEESYAFTVHGTEVRRSGSVPPGLDPDRLFSPEDFPREGELRALGAIAAAFGVTLPRFALTPGYLPTFTTRSWTRPPGPGERYVTVTVGQG
ncbi:MULTISPECIES: SMI1/KNR4 family protein [unclassified Streptomyces]|uniref:SMI1/KNR4 family protein n=1 Tax=unclassified Streptomyces TaxID=2593676 RepID=UPI00382D7E55